MKTGFKIFTSLSKRPAVCFLSLFLLLSGLTLNAQVDYSHIMSDCLNAASNHYPYIYEPQEYTDAPRGYKPFYVSHYGRHGSRYLTDAVDLGMVLEVLSGADAKGLLTKEGKIFYGELTQVYDEQSGLEGVLTTRGAEEHRGIARRMAASYPSVFDGKDGRVKVNCASSVVHRCLLSMNNFSLALQEKAPNVEIVLRSGPRYMEYIAKPLKPRLARQLANAKEDSLRRATMDPKVMFSYLFTSPDEMLRTVPDAHAFCRNLYLSSCNGMLTDARVNLLRHYPVEELCREWYLRNERFYLAYAVSYEMADHVALVAKPLLADFIGKADAALADGSDVAADLRFGHDTGLLPLVTFMGIEGQPGHLRFSEVSRQWNSSEMICMGSNLQMVFYRNKSGHVLVKLLYNEKETGLSSLQPDENCFYDWSRLRDHLLQLL